MKIRILSFFLLVICFSAHAENSEILNYNDAEMKAQFEQITEVESIILSNPELTYESLQSTNAKLTKNLSAEPILFSEKNPDSDDVPSWVWGCLIGVVGVAALGCIIVLL